MAGGAWKRGDEWSGDPLPTGAENIILQPSWHTPTLVISGEVKLWALGASAWHRALNCALLHFVNVGQKKDGGLREFFGGTDGG